MAKIQESPARPELVWAKVADILLGELGEGAFNSYVSPSCVREGLGGDVVLVTPTAYARDWVRRNAWRRMGDLWGQYDPSGRRLEVRSRHDYETEIGHAVPTLAAATGTPLSTPALSSPPGLADAVGPESAPVLEFAAHQAARPVRGAGLQERLTFDSFVPGQGNDFAYAMARRVSSWVDGQFNPVFFHGPYGNGKTHLLNAIAWEAQRLDPKAKVIYLTAERFLSTFLKALQDRCTAAFKAEVRGADLLLVDDVHFIGGKVSSQEELFHTLTALLGDGRRVVLTADRPPSALGEVDARLRSHLGAGLVCAIEPPDRTLRMGILERKLELMAQKRQIDLPAPTEVLQLLAERAPGSIRELEGALNTLVAGAGSRLSKLSLDEAQGLLQPNLRGGAERRITVDEIQKTTADHFGMKQADLLSDRRQRAVARPRQVAMYLCKHNTTRSYPDIGRRFGGKDHTTVIHAVRRIEELMAKDEQIARDVEALTRKLRG
jgi:chromosomal replication initiator protein